MYKGELSVHLLDTTFDNLQSEIISAVFYLSFCKRPNALGVYIECTQEVVFMPMELKAIDLDFLTDDDDSMIKWAEKSFAEGRKFPAYGDNFYSHAEYGALDLFLCIISNEEKKLWEVERFDFQVCGQNVWNMRCSDIELKRECACDMTRLAVVKNTHNGGFTVMHLLNAEILPSYLEDEEIKAQVTAFALEIDYYDDKESFIETLPECNSEKLGELNGSKLIPAMGSVLPMGLLSGHMANENEELKEDNSRDDLVLVVGVVKGVTAASAKLDDKEISKFIITKIETQFGDLEICQSGEMAFKNNRESIKAGDIVQATVVLSGDVAIDEYENGVIKDHEHNLRALRYAMLKGNAKRLKRIMTEDVSYESVNWNTVIKGMEKVIAHIDYVHTTTNIEYHAHLATLENTNEGERCIVLAENDENNLTAVVRISVNEEGLINRISVENDSDIRFKLDEKPVYESDVSCE